MRKLALVSVLVLAIGAAAYGDLTFSASGTNIENGQLLMASVKFAASNGTLTVTLTNTGTYDPAGQSSLLTAVFFSLPADVSIVINSNASALVASGSTVINGPLNVGNVGGEWAYAGDLQTPRYDEKTESWVTAPGGATSGISSSGFGLFGVFNLNGNDLDPPPALDGSNYAITTAYDDPSTTYGGTDEPLIQHSVVFTLSYLGELDDRMITDISFQYGTGLNEPNIIPVPGAALLSLLGFGLIGWIKRWFA